MPPTALETHWTLRVAALATKKTAALSALTAAQTDLAAAKATLAAAKATLVTTTKELEARRQSLSEPDLTPAELAARVAALRTQLVAFRAQRHAVLLAEAAGDAATRAVAERKGEVERVTREHRAAGEASAAATARAKRWADAAAALAAEPLSSLKTRAGNATKPADTTWTAAKTRIEAEIPKELRERAAERLAAERTRLAAAGAARLEIDGLVTTAHVPATGSEPGAEAALQAAEARLFDHVRRGPARFTAAVAQLAAIPRSTALTAAEVAALAESTRVTQGKAAVLLEKARDDKAAELAAKRTARETAARTALAADIDANLGTVLATLDGEIATLAGQLATAETALAAAAADLEDWEATVPESAWANLVAFETAKRELGELAAVVPADLRTAVDTATTALVAALVADDKRARTLAYLHREAGAERDRQEVATTFGDRRAAGALRGE